MKELVRYLLENLYLDFQGEISRDTVRQFLRGDESREAKQLLAKLIEDNGGLPVRLDGMTRSCREQRDSPEYREVRSRLDAYSAGKLGVDAVVAQPCDAAEIAP